MQKGDIVLIAFPFTDLSGSKLRPAIVLIKSSLDLTVCFISSQIQWQEDSDILIEPSPLNGLKYKSLIRTSKIATIDKSLAKGLLGQLNSDEMDSLDFNLIQLLQLNSLPAAEE
jgi:mRNA interferase MazF